MKENKKTLIRWGALVIIVLSICITFSSVFTDTYTLRIEASDQVKDIALKYADTQVDLFEIEYNCSEYVEMEESRAKGMELALACKHGCHVSFDRIDGNHGAAGIGGFMRHSCIDLCLEEFAIN